MRHAVIIDAVRTPIGRAHKDKGIFRDVRADDLSADLMKALLERAGVPASEIEDRLLVSSVPSSNPRVPRFMSFISFAPVRHDIP